MSNTEVRFNRFKDAPWFPKEQTEVIVGGAGGIGSWLTLLLTRAGFEPTVYDFDKYEQHNMGGQLCRSKDIGKFKIDALKEIVKEFTDFDIFTLNEKYVDTSMTHPFVFSAFDNMDARKDMFKSWLNMNLNNPAAIFIDGRLTLEQLQIFCVRGDDLASIDLYQRDHLFADSDVADAVCTLKQTSHTAAMIASHMVAFFTNHLTNLGNPDSGRAVPFSWDYYCPIDYLTSE